MKKPNNIYLTPAEAEKKYGQSIDLLDLDLLLAAAFKKTREFLYIHPEQKISARQFNNFKKLLARRKRGEPLAYLLGHKEFYGLDFKVNKNTLIPRPETEIMVAEILKNKNIKTIADIGTGSGCIAIALAKNNPNLKVYATDISAQALPVAKTNAKKHRVKIIFKKGNLLDPIKNIKLDAVAANLPYGWKSWKNNTSAETKGLKFEPSIALFTDKNGLQLYEELLKQLRGGHYKIIFLEIDPRQTKLITPLIKKYLPTAKVEIKKDLGCRDRLVIIKN